jgi:hypothetical protein
MDHEVIPKALQNMWLFVDLVRDHFDLNQGKNVIVTMEFEVPKRHV